MKISKKCVSFPDFNDHVLGCMRSHGVRSFSETNIIKANKCDGTAADEGCAWQRMLYVVTLQSTIIAVYLHVIPNSNSNELW